MMLPARSRPIVAPLLITAVFLGVIYFRALPAWFRGSYTTEGGVWLSQMWQLGFLKSLAAIRPDYCVFGNLAVMQVSEWINALWHGSNLDHAPSIQHHMACVYVALNFTIIYCVLRRSHGFSVSVLVCAVMLLMPDLDGENRIFGEVTNLGYFSALVVLFIYHDLWIHPECSRRRLVTYLLLVMFHIATSPLAGLITVAFAGLMYLREATARAKAQRNFKALLPHLVPVAFAIFTIVRAQQNSLYAHVSADESHLKARLVEVVLCRQILYPLVLNFYTWFNDARTLYGFGVFLVLIGVVVALEWKKRRPLEGARVTGFLLLLGAVLGMSVATALSRQWLILRDESYDSVWPARYYLVQNMVAGALITLLLARVADLLPKIRTALIVLVALMLANYAALQNDNIRTYLQQDDPAIVARHWPYQLRRVQAVQTMTGDQARALESNIPGLSHTVEINIENHVMHLSPEKMEKAAATRLEKPAHECPVGLADAAQIAADPGARMRQLVVRDLRAIPRDGGVLVSFDVTLHDFPYSSSKRRRLWIGRIPGQIRTRCFAYSILAGPESTAAHHGVHFNWLFKVMLYLEGSRSLTELEQQLTGLSCVMGTEPGKFVAQGVVLQPHDRLCISSLLGDEHLAALLHPVREIFHWNDAPASLHLQNLSLRGDDLVVGPARAEDFDESAYLRYNPDIAGTVARQSVASARAYFNEFGWKESRQIRRYAAKLDVSQQQIDSGQVNGIRVILKKGRKEMPPVINCVLRGPGRETALRLLPPDGGSDYCALFVPPEFKPPPHPVLGVEIEFEGVTSERTFQLREITLYQSKPS